jgi:hypothetical protein
VPFPAQGALFCFAVFLARYVVFRRVVFCSQTATQRVVSATCQRAVVDFAKCRVG